MSEPGMPPPLPGVKTRLPFEQKSIGAIGVRNFSFWMFLILTIGLAGLAYYMAAIVGHPVASPYVVAPGIGALWFGLRLFMKLAPKV